MDDLAPALMAEDPSSAVHDEARRLAKLRSFDILDTSPEEAFDDIAALARQICDAPVALVTLVDRDRQWFKAHDGLDLSQTDLSRSVCSRTMHAADAVVVIPDTRLDPRTADNPANHEVGMRFYAGAPLRTADGTPLGALCVIDTRVRDLTAAQRAGLAALGRQAMAGLHLRRALAAEAAAHLSLEARNAALTTALANERVLQLEIDHRVKNSLQLVGSLLQMQAQRASSPEVRGALHSARGRVQAISSIHGALNRVSATDTVLLTDYARQLVAELRGQAPPGVAIELEADPIELPTALASPFAILMNEFVTNSLKHAFPDGRTGTVRLTVRDEGGLVRVRFADDGVGHAAAGGSGDGLGTRLMQALAGQLGAVLDSTADVTGTELVFDFDAGALSVPAGERAAAAD